MLLLSFKLTKLMQFSQTFKILGKPTAKKYTFLTIHRQNQIKIASEPARFAEAPPSLSKQAQDEYQRPMNNKSPKYIMKIEIICLLLHLNIELNFFIMDLVGEEIRKKIREIGKLWKGSPSNPITSVDVINSWNNVILEWVKDKEMPLIIRRPKDKRGHVYTHETGRKIIISDNTPATWVMYNVLYEPPLPLYLVRKLLEKKEIPVALAFTKQEKEGAIHTKTQGKFALSDWKVCHIDQIGLNKPGSIEHIDINLLEEHFEKFLNPKNMFLVPKSIAGLGEVQEFIDEQR